MLPYAERSIPEIPHVPPNCFQCLDIVQDNLIDELQVKSSQEALRVLRVLLKMPCPTLNLEHAIALDPIKCSAAGFK